MGRLDGFFLVIALGIASAVMLASCGSGSEADLLPGTTASEIESNLEEVERLADEDNCVGAEDAVAAVVADVEELEGVDLKLKAALQEGAAKLSEVVGRCEEAETEETEPTLESDVEADEVEDEKKPKKEKSDKDGEEAAESEEEAEGDEGSELPPQAEGKGEGKGAAEAEPEAEEPAPSGGVGPGVGVE